MITGREEREESRGCSPEPELCGMANVYFYFLAVWFPTMFVVLSFFKLFVDGTYEDVIVTALKGSANNDFAIRMLIRI